MKLQLKRSNVLTSGAAKVPTASQLEYGELAINYNNSDPAIFLKDSNNNVIRISGVGNIADDGQVELPASTTPPNNPEAGNLWFNSDEGRLYIYYVDANTSQWVDASPDSYDPSVVPDMSDPNYQAGTLDDRYNSSQVGTTAPAVTTRQEGALWWNSSANEGKLYVLYNDPAPDGRKKWVEASPYPDTSSYVVKVDNGTQQNITGGGGLTVAGNVGIGTTSPAHNLDISPASGAAELKIAGAEGQEASIRLYADQGDDAADIKKLLTDTSGNFKIQHYSGSAFVDSMVIDNSGRLGVGTSSPFYKVHLEGSAPYVRIKNTSAPTDEKTWDFNAGTDGILRFRNSNDANSSSNNWLEVERNGVETNSIRLLTASGSERMRILSDGTIATGGLTATPGTVAAGSYIQHAANAGFFGNNGDAKFGSSANNPVLFQVNGSEKMRIDTSGRVMIGATSGRNNSITSAHFQIEGVSANAGSMSLIRNGSGNPAYFVIGSTGGSSIGSSTATLSGQPIGQISFVGSNGGSMISSAYIIAHNDQGAAWSANDCPSRLVFGTTSDNSQNPAERMRITGMGRVGVGLSAPVGKLDVKGDGNMSGSAFDYLYANGGGIRVVGNESAVDILSTDVGEHASSLLLRGANKGYALVNDTVNDCLRFNSFTASSANFYVHGSTGANVSAFKNILTLQKTGNVGIGLNAPSKILDIKDGGIYGAVRIDNTSTTGGGVFIASQNGSQIAVFGVEGAITGTTANNVGIMAETGKGVRLFTNGSPSVKAEFLPAGGLAFNGDTAQANALDDYEEGTWTPGLFVTSGTNPTYTVVTNYSSYTKVGSLVTFSADFLVNFSSVGSGTGLIISMPFTPSITSGRAVYSGGPQGRASTGLSPAPWEISWYYYNDGARLYRQSANGGDAGLSTSDIRNVSSARFNIGGFFYVA